MGLHVLSPKELVEFLYEEMSQDFSDLGIEIKDFLADLLKAREENQKSFDVYNNYIKLKTDNSPCPTVNNITESSMPLLSPNNKSGTHDTKQTRPPPATLPPSNLLGKFASVSEESSKQAVQVTDKPIHLKNKEMRRHVHRYDLRIGIKECRSEEEEQKLLTGLLEEFMETMLSADQSIIIPPYYELDRSNSSFLDLSKTFKISDVESFTKLKRYFSRLGNQNPNTGFVYCSCIVAASFPHASLMTKVSQILQEFKLSLWPRSCDHENVGRIGWLLYSLQDMDVARLKSLLTSLTGVEIGVKWMKISPDYGV